MFTAIPSVLSPLENDSDVALLHLDNNINNQNTNEGRIDCPLPEGKLSPNYVLVLHTFIYFNMEINIISAGSSFCDEHIIKQSAGNFTFEINEKDVCFKCKDYEEKICDLESKLKSVEDRNERLADVNNQLSEKLKIFYEKEKALLSKYKHLKKQITKLRKYCTRDA